MRDFAERFYKSKAWQKTRNAYASSVGYLCEECIAVGRYTPGEIVHHVIELTPDNISNAEIALNWVNLRLVCRNCHGKAHRSKKRYKIDEMGRVVVE